MRNFLNRLSSFPARLLAVVLSVAVGGFALGGSASAAPPTIPADPTGGAMADVQTNVQTWVLTYGVPALFALIIVGILIRLAVRWTKRAGRSV